MFVCWGSLKIDLENASIQSGKMCSKLLGLICTVPAPQHVRFVSCSLTSLFLFVNILLVRCLAGEQTRPEDILLLHHCVSLSVCEWRWMQINMMYGRPLGPCAQKSFPSCFSPGPCRPKTLMEWWGWRLMRRSNYSAGNGLIVALT